MLDNYDRKGRPITTERWGELFSEEYKRVGYQKFPDGTVVSTVWLGIDHGVGDGPPLIFETMIFGSNYEDDGDHPFTRYPTEAQAMWGHAQACQDIEHGRVPWFMRGEV